jgi:hypothetical protein
VRVKREGRVRRHNGVRQRWCHDHEAWLDEAEFRLLRKRSGDVYETVCRSCQAARARRYYVENADRIRRRNQERYDAVRDATRAARGAFPTERAPAVPVSLVGGWIQETSEDRRSELAGVVGVSHATLNRIAAGSGADVPFAVAERIAQAVGRTDDIGSLLTTGRPGWSKTSPHCLRCGRFDRPHWARGLCLRCYHTWRWWTKRGHAPPAPRDERWTVAAPLGCKQCGTRKRRHRARGLCTLCYSRHYAEAQRHGVSIQVRLDELGFRRYLDHPRWEGGEMSTVMSHAR